MGTGGPLLWLFEQQTLSLFLLYVYWGGKWKMMGFIGVSSGYLLKKLPSWICTYWIVLKNYGNL